MLDAHLITILSKILGKQLIKSSLILDLVDQILQILDAQNMLKGLYKDIVYYQHQQNSSFLFNQYHKYFHV